MMVEPIGRANAAYQLGGRMRASFSCPPVGGRVESVVAENMQYVRRATGSDLTKVPGFEAHPCALPRPIQETHGSTPILQRRRPSNTHHTRGGATTPVTISPEWEVYESKINALPTKRPARKSSSPYASPVLLVPEGLGGRSSGCASTIIVPSPVQ